MLGTVDPSLFDPASRDLLPGRQGEITTLEGETLQHRFLMGSDSFGRDIYSRVIYGAQVSLIVGVATAAVAMAIGIVLGLLAGYLRRVDGPLMRVMDGVMAIPAILIAIALVALWRGSLLTVVVAIAIPEIPRVTRLVRSLVLTIREEPYVEAAISLGTPSGSQDPPNMPNTVAAAGGAGQFICGAGILTEAILSCLASAPTEIRPGAREAEAGPVNEYPNNYSRCFIAVNGLASISSATACATRSTRRWPSGYDGHPADPRDLEPDDRPARRQRPQGGRPRCHVQRRPRRDPLPRR